MKISFKQQLAILLTLFTCLLLVLVLSPFFSSTKMVERESTQNLFTNFKSSLVNQINFKRGSSELTLIKKNQRWFVVSENQEIPANDNIVNAFLDGVKEVKTGRLVSKKANNLEEYGLDESSSTSVEFHDERDNGHEILIGHEDDSYQRRYILAGSKIYETKVPSGFTNINSKEWIDLRLFSQLDNPQKVVSFFVGGVSPFDGAKLSYRIEATSEDGKEGKIWMASELNAKCSTSEVEALLRKISSATAYGAAANVTKGQVGLESPKVTLAITGSDGIIYSLEVGEKVANENRYYAISSTTNFILEIQSSTLESLIKPIDTLLEK